MGATPYCGLVVTRVFLSLTDHEPAGHVVARSFDTPLDVLVIGDEELFSPNNDPRKRAWNIWVTYRKT